MASAKRERLKRIFDMNDENIRNATQLERRKQDQARRKRFLFLCIVPPWECFVPNIVPLGSVLFLLLFSFAGGFFPVIVLVGKVSFFLSCRFLRKGCFLSNSLNFLIASGYQPSRAFTRYNGTARVVPIDVYFIFFTTSLKPIR